jgi:hypothetical protein
MNHGFEAVFRISHHPLTHCNESWVRSRESWIRNKWHACPGSYNRWRLRWILAITPKVAWLATKMAPLHLDGEIAILRTVSSAPTIITLTLPWMQQPMRRSPFILKLVSFLTRCFGSRHNELMILETKRLYNVCILYPVHCTL